VVTAEPPIASAQGAASGRARAPIGYPEVVSAFSEVAEAINDKTDLDSLLHLVAERICALLAICRCSVYLVDPKYGVFRGQVAHSDHNIDSAIKRLTAGTEADGFTREILTTKRPVLIGNAQSDSRPVRSAMRDWGVRVMLGVPMVLHNEVIGLLFLDNEDAPHDYTVEEQELGGMFANLAAIAISQAQLTADLRATVSTAAQQNAVLRRAAALEDRLTTLVLEGASLSGIASAVTELTGKPCSIHDSEYRRLAHANVTDEANEARVPEGASLGAPAVREALQSLTARRPVVIPPIPSAGLHQRCLVAKVRVGQDDWGYLVLSEHGSRFGAQDMIVARRTATIIALELSGRQRAAEAESHAVEALARDLLHGSDDQGSLGRRADYHCLALDEPHLVVLLSLREQATHGRLSCARVGQAFATAAPELRAFVAGVEKGAAVVLGLPEASSTVEAVRRAKAVVRQVVEELAPDGSVTAALSTVCRGAEDYPSAYEQTRQISRGISTFGVEGQVHVLATEDLGPGRLLLATADRVEADRFVRDTLGGLLDDTDPGICDLLTTLRVLFHCSLSVRRSAQLLQVHENTIRYRLSRIESITGLDATDGDGRMAIQLSLLIMRLENRLEPIDEVALAAAAEAAAESGPCAD
jgi:sugar diacid utilization regulator